jgi:hypothetical protein
VPAFFQPSPILQVQHLCLHLSTLKHEREWLVDALLATDPVSVDAAALTSDCRRMAAGPTGYYEEDRKGGTMAKPINVKCPSCGQILAAADEGGLVNVLQEHLYEEHALEMPPERIRENVSAQLKDFDGYNARPISGA